MKTLFPLSLLLMILCASCGGDKHETSPLRFGTELYDSSALHVALLTNRDCLPVYYAARRGIYDALGVKVQIASYRSQIELDTALLSRTADGGWCDARTIETYGERGQGFRTMWKEQTEWALAVNEAQRVKDVKNMKGRTVAVARGGAESDMLATLLAKGGLTSEDVYRPQIGDRLLRAEMLRAGQVDAALLPWPYTSYAVSGGARLIASKTADITASFVMKPSALKTAEQQRRWKLFEQGRRMAIDSLRLQGSKAYSLILQKDYGLPKEVADTVKY